MTEKPEKVLSWFEELDRKKDANQTKTVNDIENHYRAKVRDYLFFKADLEISEVNFLFDYGAKLKPYERDVLHSCYDLRETLKALCQDSTQDKQQVKSILKKLHFKQCINPDCKKWFEPEKVSYNPKITTNYCSQCKPKEKVEFS